MKNLVYLFLLACPIVLFSQNSYETSKEFPYGKINPAAPVQLAEFAPMIGICDCTSETRNPDGTWNKPESMTWTFKYIMNGLAIQDETSKNDGTQAGSIRQYHTDSSKWVVHYYSSTAVPFILPAWTGEKKNDKIILYRDQKAPNGMEGFYRLTFYDITDTGYKWAGEWVNVDESIVYPTWKIDCKKRN